MDYRDFLHYYLTSDVTPSAEEAAMTFLLKDEECHFLEVAHAPHVFRWNV